MNKNIVLLLILWGFSVFFFCDKKSTIHFPLERILLKIESVSPNGEYAIVNICDLSDARIKLRDYYHPLMQFVLDSKSCQYWPLLDTTIFYDAWYFAWSRDSKKVLFSATLHQPKDTFDLFPIYLYDLQSRISTNLKKPWLNTPHYNIPLFSYRESEIIFWAPGVIVDTLQPSYTTIGRVFKWDTLQKSITEIINNENITSAKWIGLYDTTDLFVQANNILWRLSLSTGDLDNILPEVRIVREIRRCKNKIVFPGTSEDEHNRIFVYDLEKEFLETIFDYNKGTILSASINNTNKLAVETIKDGQYWIFIMLEDGSVLDSVKGYTPFWLAGTDSLIYSEGEKISLAYWQKKQLKREIILEIVR
ncbi:hypothetical protein ES705_09058 [subsurface metagenome]